MTHLIQKAISVICFHVNVPWVRWWARWSGQTGVCSVCYGQGRGPNAYTKFKLLPLSPISPSTAQQETLIATGELPVIHKAKNWGRKRGLLLGLLEEDCKAERRQNGAQRMSVQICIPKSMSAYKPVCSGQSHIHEQNCHCALSYPLLRHSQTGFLLPAFLWNKAYKRKWKFQRKCRFITNKVHLRDTMFSYWHVRTSSGFPFAAPPPTLHPCCTKRSQKHWMDYLMVSLNWAKLVVQD